jgi:hypothetical protein
VCWRCWPGRRRRSGTSCCLEARELPEELAGIDEPLRDAGLLRPIAERWERSARERGRPTIAMETCVRLMVIKQHSGFGYEALVREVSEAGPPPARQVGPNIADWARNRRNP